MMTELFTLDIMVGHVLPIQDEPCLFPTVTLKLLNFPRLTIHSIPPLEQQELKRKFRTEIPSTMSGSHNCIVFKKGKSCSFELSKLDTQKLFFPLTVILSDAWCIPVKELGRTCIDILIPHFKQESVNLPVSSNKQIYELCNANGSKVAMIELSYKLKHIKTDVTNTVSDYKEKPAYKEDTSKKEKLEKSVDVKEILQEKILRSTDNASVNKLYDELTICPPPLLFTAHSDNVHEKLPSELEPAADQDVNQVVWPNGYIHTGWNESEEDNYDTALLPSCPQHAASSTKQGVSNHQNFWILRALVKELSAMEQLLNSKGVIHPEQKYSDMCVQTEDLTNNEPDDIFTPTKTVPKKLAKQKKFTRECCATKLDHSQLKQPRKVKCSHKATPLQSKGTSPRVKSMHQTASPRNISAPPDDRTRKIKIRSPPKQKLPPKILNSAVSRLSQIRGDKDTETDEPASEEFSINTSVEHKGDQSSKLNLEIHLPAVMPSITTMSLKQDDAVSNSSINNTIGLLTLPTDSLPPSSTPMASTIPLKSRYASHTATAVASALALSSASQSGHLTQASSSDLQSYANSLLSQSSGDILNQSHISNLVFSAKHLESIVADNKSTKDTSLTSDNDELDAISPTASNESLQYKDDFESSECSISKETLSSLTSRTISDEYT